MVSEDQAVMPSKAAGRDGSDTGLQGCSILASEGDTTTIEKPPEKLFLPWNIHRGSSPTKMPMLAFQHNPMSHLYGSYITPYYAYIVPRWSLYKLLHEQVSPASMAGSWSPAQAALYFGVGIQGSRF